MRRDLVKGQADQNKKLKYFQHREKLKHKDQQIEEAKALVDQ